MNYLEALQGSESKWKVGVAQTEEDYQYWWLFCGGEICCVCEYFYELINSSVLKCMNCFLYDKKRDSCCKEWRTCYDAVDNSDFKWFHKSAMRLLDRIQKEIERVENENLLLQPRYPTS